MLITQELSSILIIIFSYFLGSISSAIVICKTLLSLDPRNHGSKNPGATNIFRIAGYKFACAVALFDFLKGAIPVYIGFYLHISSIYLQITVIFVCVGHMYPVFFKFYGGKAVATAFGALTALSANIPMIMIIIWILIVFYFRYVSLGSIITFIIIPFYVWFVQPQYFICVTLLSILILVRHIDNIKRLCSRQEQRIQKY